jgi:hypothetical protein
VVLAGISSARKLSLLVVALLWPTLVTAVPILGEDRVVGWANDRGNFVVDTTFGSSVFGLADAGLASYSTTTSLLSFSASTIGVVSFDPFSVTISGPADIRMDAIVRETGTVSGDLLAGILTARAGADGFPNAGIAADELFFVANAIEAAAVSLRFSTSFLFEVVYATPALSNLPHYLTFYGPWPPHVWFENPLTPESPFKPWGESWANFSGFTEYTLIATRQLPEPSSLALLGIAFACLLGFSKRRSSRTPPSSRRHFAPVALERFLQGFVRSASLSHCSW